MAKETIDLGKFARGLNNVSPDTDLPEHSLVSAINVNIDKEGNILRRKGYTQVHSGTNIHSLFNNYFAEGSLLKDLDNNVMYSNLSLTKFLAWEKVLGVHYYSDGDTLRTVEYGKAGVDTPSNNASFTITSGLLDTGTYQVAIAWRNNTTGEVGGVNLASSIDIIITNGGILVSNIPINSDGYDTVIYCSTQNGKELYQNGIVFNGLTNYTIINSSKSTSILNTQFMEPLPGGHIIRHFKARLYIARDNVLWYSESFRYGLRKTSQDFFQFPSKILIVQAVSDGLFVVADKTYFLAGTDPKSMNQTVVSEDKAIEGTGISIGGQSFGLEADIEVGYWFSDKGAILGLPEGKLKLLTEDRLALETGFISGTTMLKEQNGTKQMITSFNSKGTQSNMEYGAQATAAIYRNGILVT